MVHAECGANVLGKRKEQINGKPNSMNTLEPSRILFGVLLCPYKKEQDHERSQSKSRTWNRFNPQTIALRAR